MNEPSQEPIELKLDSGNGANNTQQGQQDYQGQQDSQAGAPVIGWIAVACGVLGVFTASIFFVPLALVCSVIAFFMGQFLWGIMGIVLAIIGFLTSPVLLGIIGLSALAAYFGF
ncbi:MAG: hypothetical protein HON65_15285 [Rhodospirillales bacterium]|nr:hypothetical protein [Rhodospirillales bacterium]